jgi:hypothetical protein
MMNSDDINRVQTAVGSQQSGNDVVGTMGLKGGFACNSSGHVTFQSGPFTVLPDSGGAVGTYRAYPNFPAGSIVSLDNITVGGFTPRSPSASETTQALVTGFNIDTANNKWYITIAQADFTGALQGSLPTKFVIGIQCAVTFAASANPL